MYNHKSDAEKVYDLLIGEPISDFENLFSFRKLEDRKEQSRRTLAQIMVGIMLAGAITFMGHVFYSDISAYRQQQEKQMQESCELYKRCPLTSQLDRLVEEKLQEYSRM